MLHKRLQTIISLSKFFRYGAIEKYSKSQSILIQEKEPLLGKTPNYGSFCVLLIFLAYLSLE